jgi:1-acyl-sn-glycerol-3-phosphate acyltransferase/MFS family permease
VLAARSCLFSLWIAQVARTLADSCLRVFIVLQLSRCGLDTASVWLVSLPFFIAPFVLLAPLNGALSNSFPKRWILAGSAAFCLCITALFAAVGGAQGDLWLWCIGLALVGTGHAGYSSARYAILPAAAQDTRWPLNRVMAYMEAGDALAAVAGFLLALSLGDLGWSEAMAALGWKSTPASPIGHWELPVAVAAAIGLDLVGVFCSLRVRFASDRHRPERPAQAIAGFFRDAKVIGKDGVASGSLLSLAYFLGVIAAASGAGSVPAVNLGLVVGCLLASVQGHPRRMLGLVPPAALGLVAALVWAAAGSNLLWAYLLLGLMAGLIIVPLRTLVQLATPADMRGNAMALMNAANSFSTLAPALLLSEMTWLGIESPAVHFWMPVVAAAAGTLVAWRVLLRETVEQVGEILLGLMYRIRVRGPGCFQIPLRGSLLVIANHTAWFDPLWLAKVLPRRLTPMMTSKFFDLPILHWLMSSVAGAIRVPVAPFRREAPELQDAVAVLDGGGCVLIFPEGSMKRRPEQSLRHFGQGVWRILRQRPQTPVVVCWIEGGWGSYTSYCGGPPAVNKQLDFRRLIQIALETPQPLDPALLANQQATRSYLMRACLNARRHLGLQPLPLQPGTTEAAENDIQCENEER